MSMWRFVVKCEPRIKAGLRKTGSIDDDDDIYDDDDDALLWPCRMAEAAVAVS